MAQPIIERITIGDILTITRMAYANMVGADQQFTRFANNPLTRWLGYFLLPFYFLFAGRGYKATLNNQIVGCAYLHLRQHSGLVFNVSVNPPHRRLGIAHHLMNHIETVVQQHQLTWLALQVDSQNTPAHTLYHRLGYTAYHPTYLRREPASHRHFPATPGIHIEPLPRSQGRIAFEQYRALERRSSDGALATVIKYEYTEPTPAGGQFWRILYNNKEIGCTWLGGDTITHPHLSLHLDPHYWAHPLVTPTLLHHHLNHIGHPVPQLTLHLGSPQHLKIAQPHLQQHGFQPHQHPRLLMLKPLTASH